MGLWHLSSQDFIATADLATYFSSRGGTVGSTTGLVGNWVTTSYTIWRAFPSLSPASVWAHFHYYQNSAFTGDQFFFAFGDCTASGIQVPLALNSSRYIRVATPGGNWPAAGPEPYCNAASSATGTIPIEVGRWYDIRVEATINNTTGIVKVWVNGVLDINATGLDTQASANAWANTWIIGSSYTYIDDLMVGDTSGSILIAAPDECRIDCMMPNANGTDRANGGSGEMTRSTGSDDYTLVDETSGSSAGTGDYIYADAVGEKCSLNVAALTNTGGTILTVQCTVYATKNEAGPCGFKIYCLRGGTRYYSSEFFPSFGSWAYFRKNWDQDPSTSAAWTESNFNAAEFGVERTT